MSSREPVTVPPYPAARQPSDAGTSCCPGPVALVLHKRFTGSKYNMVHGITITGISKAVQKNADWTY